MIDAHQKRPDPLDELQSLVTEGIRSGISDRSMQEILEAARLHVAAAPADGDHPDRWSLPD